MRLLLLTLITLSACQSADPSPAATPEQAGIRVENWRGAAATVRAFVYGDSSFAVAATGSVSAAGVLAFGLKPLPLAQLSSFMACSGVTVSDPELKLNSFSAFDVTRDLEGETPEGQIAQASRFEIMTDGLQQVGDYYVQYTYADRPAQIKGRCQGGAPASFSYALDLARGWNPVVFKLFDEAVLELSTAPVPADAAWFFSEVGP